MVGAAVVWSVDVTANSEVGDVVIVPEICDGENIPWNACELIHANTAMTMTTPAINVLERPSSRSVSRRAIRDSLCWIGMVIELNRPLRIECGG